MTINIFSSQDLGNLTPHIDHVSGREWQFHISTDIYWLRHMLFHIAKEM